MDWNNGESVVVGSGSGRLIFGVPPTGLDQNNELKVPVRIEANGLIAGHTIELEGWGGWIPGLIEYFGEIAASWRGWSGSQDWHDDGTDFRLSATHDGVGTILLRVEVGENSGEHAGNWRLSAFIAVEPGSVDATVSALRALLRHAV